MLTLPNLGGVLQTLVTLIGHQHNQLACPHLYSKMEDDELQAIRAARMAELRGSGGGGGPSAGGPSGPSGKF